MALGPFVRGLFGRHEHRVAEAYRAIYIDLDAWIGQIGAWVPAAGRILEVGCGEGAMTERLALRYPDAAITAIDVSPGVGRLYRGARGRVTFAQADVAQVAAREPGGFDLVILSDVLHHVPVPARDALLAAIRTCTAPEGRVVFKDWARAGTPIHLMCAASDRFLTGDRVTYLSAAELRRTAERAFGPASIDRTAHVRPWRSNLGFLVRPQA